MTDGLAQLNLQDGEEKRIFEKITLKPDEIANYRRLARLLGQRKRFREAVAVLDVAAERKLTDDRETQNLLGRLCEAAGESERAIRIWRGMLRDYPADITPLEKLERIYRQRDQRRQMIKVLEDIGQESPLRERALRRLVLLLKEGGDLKGALRQQKILVDNYPPDFSRLKELGRLSEKTGHLRDAVRCYKEALSLQGGDPDVLLCVGVCQRKTGWRKEARSTFQELLRLKPGFYGAHIHLAEMEIEEGNLEAAEAHLRCLDSRWPGNSRVGINRAHILHMRGKHREALELARESAAQTPSYYTDEMSLGHRVLSLIYAALRQEEEAQYHRLLSEHLQGSSDSFKAAVGLIDELIKGRNPKLAEKVAQGLLKNFPGNSLAFIKMAEIGRLKNDWEGAVACAERASRESNPRYRRDKIRALQILSELYESGGFSEKAQSARETISAIESAG